MQFRLPEMFCDAKQAIEDSLENKKLVLSQYNSSLVNMCDVTHYHIEEQSDSEHIGSIKLLITYKERLITKYDKFKQNIYNTYHYDIKRKFHMFIVKERKKRTLEYEHRYYNHNNTYK